MNADQIIGERVHILMRRDRISQEQLGQALGIAQASASKKLLGQRGWTVDELIAVARFLDVQVTDLLPGNDYAPVLVGRGRVGSARSKGLEPPTFCFGDIDAFWTLDREASLLILDAAYEGADQERSEAA